MDCISKGKARKRYEFGCKVSVATTYREGFVLGMRSMPGNPYDGHTLHEALEQVEILADARPQRVFVDRGYRGHGIAPATGTAVYVSGQRRGMTRALRRALRRRSAIEPTIGHMKTDGRLSRSTLKGNLGDALHAVLCGAGHNIPPDPRPPPGALGPNPGRAPARHGRSRTHQSSQNPQIARAA